MVLLGKKIVSMLQQKIRIFFPPEREAILCLYTKEENYRAAGRAMDSSNDRQLSVPPKSMEP